MVSCRFHFPHSFGRSRCLRPAALTRWRSAGWGGGSKIDGSGAGGASREAPARASAPELAELVEQPGPVDYASGTKGRVPLVFPPVATATTDGARPWAARSYVAARSEEHTSELQSLMRISYAVFCLKKKKNKYVRKNHQTTKQKIKRHTTIKTNDY